MNLIPCTHAMIESIDVQYGQVGETLQVRFSEIPAKMLHDHARAIEKDGEILGALGVFPMWPGVASGWVLLSGYALEHHWKSISRHVKRELDAVIERDGLRRVQTVVRADWVKAMDWAEWLGFTADGVFDNYGYGGEGTFLSYARVI